MYIEEEVRGHVEFILMHGKPNIGELLNLQFSHYARDKVVASMPVNGKTHQPFGLLHGGASVVLAETVASVGAWLNTNLDSQYAVGIEINANHLRAVRSGTVTATATPLHIGNQIHVWQVEIHDDRNHLICVSRCTLAIQHRRS